ncbi:MAG TPA: hypothetical protein VIX20_10790 [Ktedonobacteraceae bacterium]
MRGNKISRWKAIRLKLYINTHTIAAIIIVALAVAFRIILTALTVPEVNGDEGTMGLEAMHIAFQGQHPVFLYGQNYMGVLEAYIAAFFFRLFGVSVFTLRIGMVLMFALFLVSMYLLTSLLYTRRLALVTIGLLGLGAASDVSIQQLRAVGGAIETLLFGSLVLLLACWLALTLSQIPSKRQMKLRLIAYGCWGLSTGIGLWTHVLVLPFVLAAGLILALFCYRELRSAAPLVLLLCLVIGLLPFILYNIHSSPPGSTIIQEIGMQKSTVIAQEFSQHLLRKRVIGTSLWSLPLATGLTPACALNDLPYYGGLSSATFPCIIIHGSWSLGYLVLLAIAILLAVGALWKFWLLRRKQAKGWTEDEREAVIIHFSRLMILMSAALTLALYVESPLSGLKPYSTRYLVGLLIAIPAVLWPLWRGAGLEKVILLPQVMTKHTVYIKGGMLLLIAVTILAGTVATFTKLPAIEADNQQQEALVHDLLRIGATHVYTDYWTGYRVMIQSQEQIICAIPPILYFYGNEDRYAPYRTIVSSDPRAAYLFTLDASVVKEFTRQIAHLSKHYKQFVFDGYVVFQPVTAGSASTIHS